MSYSRRQLEAFGEPLGESATRLKEGGFGRVYGGGGSPKPADNQVSTTTQISDIPERLRPYQMDIVNKAQALTDITQNPYQAYGGQRVADLSDLQKTAMGSVASPEAWGKNVQGYMSPYMQNVVEAQQRNAREQAGIQQGGMEAKAAQMGAFGGSGLALQRAASNRDLQRQLGDIQSTGLQTAFQQGTQQANTALGQQTQLGALQQQQAQQGLDVAYNNFLEQKNYPYQQLSYFSNMLRGLPMGMSNTSQVYQAPPTAMQNIAALGAGAYGLSKAFAAGGEVGGVESQSNVDRIVHNIKSDADLQRALRAAQARNDVDELEAIQNEMAMRASLRNGLAGTVTPQMVQRMAGGGILAFAEGGKSTDEELATPMSDDTLNTILAMEGEGGGGGLRANPQISQIASRLMNPDTSTYTPTQMNALKKYYYQQEMADAGPNVAAEKYGKYLADMESGRGQALEQSKGLAALAAIPAILQPGGTARGLAGGLASFGGEYGKALQADKASQQFLAKAQFEMADAQRKERMGMHKEAAASAQNAAKLVQEAKKQKMLGEAKAGELLVKQQQAQAIAARGAGGGGKEFVVGPAAYEARLRELHKDWSDAQIKSEAFKMYQQGKGPGYQGAAEKVDATIAANADKAWADLSRREKRAFAEQNRIDVTNPLWLGAAQKAYQEDYAARARPAAPTPAPATPRGTTGGVNVVVNGTTYTFPDQASADQFKAAAGVK